MSNMQRNSNVIYSNNAQVSAVESSRFMSRVYAWMMLGVFLTGAIAYQTANSPAILEIIFGSQLVFWSLVLAQLGAVIFLSVAIKKINFPTAVAVYLGYSALTGLTLSTIFLGFTQQSITSAFFVTAFSFGGLSAYGFSTNRDLTAIRSFCVMGLFGLIGVSLLSFFVPSLMGDVAQKMMGAVGVIVFAGLTAYDTQKIKALQFLGESQSDIKKGAIFGALLLYLDFINLFLSILRLMGEKK